MAFPHNIHTLKALLEADALSLSAHQSYRSSPWNTSFI
jgi:hypothetical protein